MKSFFILVSFLSVSIITQAQTRLIDPSRLSPAEQVQLKEWTANLYDAGVKIQNDTFTLSKEAKLAATDSVWRAALYPPYYTWINTQALLENMEIKMALWYMINLYNGSEQHKELALKLAVSLDQAFDIEKALLAAFYTYVFFDPQAGQLVDGKPVIEHPEIMESKLAVVKEMADHIRHNRELAAASKPNGQG